MALSARRERLDCGVELGVLVDQVAESLPPVDPDHQVHCRHCRAALAELEPLWGQVRELAREEISVPATLIAVVMRAVRRRPGEGTETLPLEDVVPRLVRHALLLDERGVLKIADSVIAQVVSRAALATPGVCSIDRPGLTVEVDGNLVSAQLGLVIDFGWVIPEVVAAARSRVADAVRRMTGLETIRIAITVAEIGAGDD